jgi:hypothetical protein
MNAHSRQVRLGLALAVLGGATVVSGCTGAIVHTRVDAAQLLPNVATVVALPLRLGYGKAAEQRRASRRTGDTIIQATGGHAILADELSSTDPELLADAVRTFGEDPTRTLTFSVIAARAERVEAVSVPGAGGPRPVHRFLDFTVRLDVRRADSRDILGSIETFATTFARAPEIGADGKPVGLQAAIDSAVAQALKTFAPNLVSAPMPLVVEVPARSEEAAIGGALAAVDKLRRLQVLYPELSMDDMAALASSNARFMVVNAGPLGALGLARGDLVSGMGGQNLGGRAALARTLARGETPAMTIDRGGSRFLVGQTLVARAR